MSETKTPRDVILLKELGMNSYGIFFIVMFYKNFLWNQKMMGWDKVELEDLGKELSHVVFE